MAELLGVGEQIGFLFFYITLGFLGRRLKIWRQEGDKAILDFIYYFALPALTVSSMSLKISAQELRTALIILGMSIVLVVLSCLFTMFLAKIFRMDPKVGSTFEFTTSFGNVGHVGMPVCYLLYGQLGLFYGAIYALGHNFLFWTLGIWLINREDAQRLRVKEIFNPVVVSIIIGFALAVFNLQLPSLFFKALNGLGQTTVSLVFFLAGSMLGEIEKGGLFTNRITYVASFTRLLFFPLGTILVLQFIPFLEDVAKAVVVLMMGVPAGAMAPAITLKYNGAYELSSHILIFTTLFCLFTIPIVIWLFSSI